MYLKENFSVQRMSDKIFFFLAGHFFYCLKNYFAFCFGEITFE